MKTNVLLKPISHFKASEEIFCRYQVREPRSLTGVFRYTLLEATDNDGLSQQIFDHVLLALETIIG